MPRLLLPPLPGHAAGRAPARRPSPGRSSTAGRRGVPWGISESGFNAARRRRRLPVPVVRRARPGAEARPGPGPGGRPLRHGCWPSTVAPHGGAGQLPPPAPARGPRGRYGFYEAIDYTPDRLPRRPAARWWSASYMAHHQGMSLVRAGQLPARRRRCRAGFHAEPMVRAAELLLQERVPPDAPLVQPHGDEAAAGRRPAGRRAAAQPPADHAAHARARARTCCPTASYTRHGHQRRRRAAAPAAAWT